MDGQGQDRRNPDATCFVGGLDERVDDEILWELFNQMGPVASVYVPKDKLTGRHQGYGFVEFRGEDDVEYAIKTLNMIKLYNKPIKVNRASSDKETKQRDVGAKLFVGNLSEEVTEKILFDTFSAFGGVAGMPKLGVDEDGKPKGFGFVSFENFAASDLAIDCMNGQHLCGKVVNVQYALRRDGSGERYGSEAERAIAAAAPRSKFMPHTMFSAGAGDASVIAAPAHTAQIFAAPGMPMPGMPGMPGMPMPGVPIYDQQQQYMYGAPPMNAAPFYPGAPPPLPPHMQEQMALPPMSMAPPPPPPPAA